MKKTINLNLEIDKDGSGCGTLTLHQKIGDNFYTLAVVHVDAEQAGLLKDLVGDYIRKV